MYSVPRIPCSMRLIFATIFKEIVILEAHRRKFLELENTVLKSSFLRKTEERRLTYNFKYVENFTSVEIHKITKKKIQKIENETEK